MKENTNKAIAYNSLILYAKMGITTICALLTTRFGLKALGVVDYGLFALLGGIISFMAVLNHIMMATSNRFIAVALGKGNVDEANRQFNVNLSIHIAVALLVLIIAYPVGDWYIHRYVNYDGPISNAMMVYCISVVGSAIGFVKVPYTGLLMAREKFIVFSAADVFVHVVKLVMTWLLMYYFSHKLLIYTLTFSLLHVLPLLFYILFCFRKYPEIVRLRVVRDRKMYKNVFGFSTWIGVGALAHTAKTQGASMIVNAFFNTVMNSAMGVAANINSYVTIFAHNITQPMAPQITKSYAAGNKARTDELLIMATKYGYLFTLLMGAVFLAAPDWIMGIWLGDVPPYATTFLVLFIIDSLVMSLNSGIQSIIFASGKLGLYQACSSILNIFSVVLGYFVLRGGAPAYYLTVSYVIVSIVRFFVIQWALHHSLNYDNRILWRHSYFPSLLTTALYVPTLFIPDMSHPLIKLVFTFLYLCVLIFFVGLNHVERNKLLSFVKSKVHRKRKR